MPTNDKCFVEEYRLHPYHFTRKIGSNSIGTLGFGLMLPLIIKPSYENVIRKI